MEQRDVKLRVVFDGANAANGVLGLGAPKPANSTGPTIPGASPADAGAGDGDEPSQSPGDVARGGRPLSDSEAERLAERLRPILDRREGSSLDRGAGSTVGTTPGALASAAIGGRLSSEVQETAAGFAATIPGGGGVFRTALLAEKYGPAVAAALETALPEAARPIATAFRQSVESLARGVATARAYLDAGGETIEATREMAFGEARLTGRVNTDFLTSYAKTRYSIAAQLAEAESFRRIYGMEKMGGAAGAVVEDMAARLAASFRMSGGAR